MRCNATFPGARGRRARAAVVAAAALLLGSPLSVAGAGEGEGEPGRPVPAAPPRAAARTAPVPPTVVALVDGEPILTQTFIEEVNTLIPQEGYHGGVKPERIRALEKEALDRLVVRRLMVAEARRRGIAPDAEAVERSVREVRGRFRSDEEFARELAKAKLAIEDVVEELVKQNLEGELLRREVDVVAVDEAAAEAFYKENAARFTRPERYRMRQILFVADPSKPRATWAEVRARAEAARKRVVEGREDFMAVIRDIPEYELAEGAGKEVVIHAGTLEPAIEDALKQVEAGGVTRVVETIYGYHVIRLDEKLAGEKVPFDAVKEKIRSQLTDVRRKERKEAFIASLKAKAKIEVLVESLR